MTLRDLSKLLQKDLVIEIWQQADTKQYRALVSRGRLATTTSGAGGRTLEVAVNEAVAGLLEAEAAE